MEHAGAIQVDDTATLTDWLDYGGSVEYFHRGDICQLSNAIVSHKSGHVNQMCSVLATTDYDWITRTFVIHPLNANDKSVIIKNSLWQLDSISLVGLWPNASEQWAIVAYTVLSGLQAEILFADKAFDSDFRSVGCWDMAQHWLKLLSYYGKNMNGPKFDCDLSSNRTRLLISGPSEHFGSTWATKIIDVHTNEAQLISVEGFRWSAVNRFHPRLSDVLTLVCCRRTEFVENFARPNTSGSLILYDSDKEEVIQRFTCFCVSTEVIKFSRNGDTLIVRDNERKELAVLDSIKLTILMKIPHDVSTFNPNHFFFTTLYPVFPVFSKCDKYIAVMQPPSARSGSTNDSIITTCTLPVVLKQLKELCRFVICGCLDEDISVQSLPLPLQLKQFVHTGSHISVPNNLMQ